MLRLGHRLCHVGRSHSQIPKAYLLKNVQFKSQLSGDSHVWWGGKARVEGQLRKDNKYICTLLLACV